ncbi:hypothetical protein GCM10023113_04510 [Cellulomonas oligotrophica]|uniref:Uncharacterized protein n=1 Tax=Cellulomonas oligotrophica TaxID=931536 RepID=A0ABQ4D9S8_9CELL|nr:hypothetical protein Col01nite_16500 [Cellulomonas oligotrophica]
MGAGQAEDDEQQDGPGDDDEEPVAADGVAEAVQGERHGSSGWGARPSRADPIPGHGPDVPRSTCLTVA